MGICSEAVGNVTISLREESDDEVVGNDWGSDHVGVSDRGDVVVENI